MIHKTIMARMAISFFLCMLICGGINSANASLQLAQEKQWHILEVGFNLGFPDRVPIQEPSLNIIAELGVRHVRIYEIFDGKTGVEYQKRLKRAIDITLKHGMLPMLCISNVPTELIPDVQVRKELVELLPSRVAGKVKKILLYSNRFPPSDLQLYSNKIQELVDFLFMIYGREQVAHWWFEIGNEPDAPLYYWGTPEQFKKTSTTAINVLGRNGINNVGGYGMTPHAIFQSENLGPKSRDFGQLMHNIITNTNINDYFMSFHLYERNNQNVQASPLSELPVWLGSSRNQVMITEWNVSSQGGKATRTFEKPGAWGWDFILLLTDCYQNKIDRLYIFKLMDSPLFSTLQLGAFYSNGEPKRWFLDFIAIWQVIRDGYLVQALPHDGFSIQGMNGDIIIVAGRKEVEIDTDHYQLSTTSENHFLKSAKVSAGEWAIFELNREK